MELFNQPHDNPSALVWIFVGFALIMAVILIIIFAIHKRSNEDYENVYNKSIFDSQVNHQEIKLDAENAAKLKILNEQTGNWTDNEKTGY